VGPKRNVNSFINGALEILSLTCTVQNTVGPYGPACRTVLRAPWWKFFQI